MKPQIKRGKSITEISFWLDVFSMDSTRMLDSMAHRFVDSIKPSTIEDYGGRKPLFQESIEYYNSKELKEKIRKIVKSPRTKSKK